MCPLDRHDLCNLDDALLLLDGMKCGEGSADMEAVDCGRVGILKPLLVPSGIGILRESLELLDDNTSGLPRKLPQELPRLLLDQDGKHIFASASVIPQDIVRIEGYELTALLDLGDHLPVAVVPLAPDHPGDQFVETLPCLFEVMKIPPGGFFHGDALDLAAGIVCGRRHTPPWAGTVFNSVQSCHIEQMCHNEHPGGKLCEDGFTARTVTQKLGNAR